MCCCHEHYEACMRELHIIQHPIAINDVENDDVKLSKT